MQWSSSIEWNWERADQHGREEAKSARPSLYITRLRGIRIEEDARSLSNQATDASLHRPCCNRRGRCFRIWSQFKRIRWARSNGATEVGRCLGAPSRGRAKRERPAVGGPVSRVIIGCRHPLPVPLAAACTRRFHAHHKLPLFGASSHPIVTVVTPSMHSLH